MAIAARRVAGVLLALLLPVAYVVTAAGAAHAADGYRYWNYFHVSAGRYAFAQTGPSGFKPADGSVEAYRYGLASGAAGLRPRTAATTYTFDDLCGGSEAAAGKKRVGVLLDYGTRADAAGGDTPPAPRGACAVVPAAANGQQVLDAVAKVRVGGGLVCGIDGYPVKGCSVTVKNPPARGADRNVAFALPRSTADTQPPSSSASGAGDGAGDGGSGAWTLAAVVAGVVVIGGAALALARRRQAA